MVSIVLKLAIHVINGLNLYVGTIRIV